MMGWRDLILEIQAQGDDGIWEVGTGFPIASGLILTARHVLYTNDDQKRTAIWARWDGYGQKADFDAEVETKWSEHYREYLLGEVLWDDQKLDVALLKVPHPVNAPYIRLSASAHAVCEERQSRGFPNGAKILGKSEGINIRGSYFPPNRGQHQAQFDPVDPPHDLEDWRGMSGAPLFDEARSRADAIVVIAREAFGSARVLKVVCAKDVLEAEGFREQLLDGLSGGNSPSPKDVQEWLASHQQACRYRCEGSLENLHANRRVRRRLIDMVGLDQSLADQPEVFADECLDKFLADPQRGLDVLGEIEADHRGKDAHKPLCDLIHNLALLLLSEVEASVVMLRDTVSATTEYAPGNPTSLEVRAAQIDRRALDLQEQRRAIAEIPAGRNALNIMSAETGPSKGVTSDASENDLLVRTGHRFPARAETVEKFMLGNEPLLVGVQSAPLSEDNKGDLRNAFRLKKIAKQTYYLAHLLNLPVDLQEKADHLADYFRETYPDVIIIPIDTQKWDADVAKFAAVINTIPVVPDDQN